MLKDTTSVYPTTDYYIGFKPNRHLDTSIKWEDLSKFLETAKVNKEGAWEVKAAGRTYCLWTLNTSGKQHVYIQEKELFLEKEVSSLLHGTLKESGTLSFDRQYFNEALKTTRKVIKVVTSTLYAPKVVTSTLYAPKEESKAKEPSRNVAQMVQDLEKEEDYELLVPMVAQILKMTDEEILLIYSRLSGATKDKLGHSRFMKLTIKIMALQKK